MGERVPAELPVTRALCAPIGNEHPCGGELLDEVVTEQGRIGLEENRRNIIRYLWDTWPPVWEYTDEAFNRSTPSFDNPDFVEITLHSYRHRRMNAPAEERFIEVELKLAEGHPILVPSIVLRGEDSGFGKPKPDPSEG
jgi:hypothetical protein